MIPVERGCVTLVWPLAVHPTNKNEIIVWDLACDPRELAALDADAIRTRMFSKADALPEGVSRLPIKTIHLNKSPIVIGNVKPYLPILEQKWGLDIAVAMQHAEYAGALPNLSAIWNNVFKRPNEAALDVDEDLYGGFVGNNDRRLLNQLRRLTPEQLAKTSAGFDDGRLEELLFRYRARNFPATLNDTEQLRWQEHRAARLFEGAGGARTVDQLSNEIDQLSETADEQGEAILGELYDYAELILPTRN
ncbi:MAG TPA: exodeoxyribonuclease I, partial [Burkholderiaceae bacterium]|nr:exodeoxyribonuclease I [Burkholderiaceae bacterium]